MSQDVDLFQGTREELHQAMQAHSTAAFGSGVVTKWVAFIEQVDSDGNVCLLPLMSETMAPWDLFGITHMAQHVISDWTCGDED